MTAQLDPDDIHEAVSPALRALEGQREEARRASNKAMVALGVMAAVGGAIGLAVGAGIGLLFGLVIGGVLGGIVYHFMCSDQIKAYKLQYKATVVREIIARTHPELHYSPEGGISEGEFCYSNLFTSPDRFHSEDGFRGKIGDTDVRFSELKAERKHKDSKGNTSYSTIFDGIFMIADFHKDFRGTVRVVPDTAEKVFGFLGKALQGFRPMSDEKLVYLEDPEFEKEFAVYGTDQVEARYILSTSMVGRILDLRAKWGEKIWLSFAGSEVAVALSQTKDILEPSFKTAADDRAQVMRFADELQVCFSVVDDLNLNTRIWTKE